MPARSPRVAVVRVARGYPFTTFGSMQMPNVSSASHLGILTKQPNEPKEPHSPPQGKGHLVLIKRGTFTITIRGENDSLKTLTLKAGQRIFFADHPVGDENIGGYLIGQHSSLAGPEGADLERWEFDLKGFGWSERNWTTSLPTGFDEIQSKPIEEDVAEPAQTE